MKYRKKPVVVEAVQFAEKNIENIKKYFPGLKLEENFLLNCAGKAMAYYKIDTSEGELSIKENDWIIKAPDPKGGYRFWPIDPEYFANNYKKVEE